MSNLDTDTPRGTVANMKNRINIYVYPDERDAYDRAASALGLSRSAWVTMTLLKPPRSPRDGTLRRHRGAVRIGLSIAAHVEQPDTHEQLRGILRAAAGYTPDE